MKSINKAKTQAFLAALFLIIIFTVIGCSNSSSIPENLRNIEKCRFFDTGLMDETKGKHRIMLGYQDKPEEYVRGEVLSTLDLYDFSLSYLGYKKTMEGGYGNYYYKVNVPDLDMNIYFNVEYSKTKEFDGIWY